jgi:hypothetical protein
LRPLDEGGGDIAEHPGPEGAPAHAVHEFTDGSALGEVQGLELYHLPKETPWSDVFLFHFNPVVEPWLVSLLLTVERLEWGHMLRFLRGLSMAMKDSKHASLGPVLHDVQILLVMGGHTRWRIRSHGKQPPLAGGLTDIIRDATLPHRAW